MKNKYISPPFLSTSFSESGKKAKDRFANILDTGTKKSGAGIIALAVVTVFAVGALVACKNERPAPLEEETILTGKATELYALRGGDIDEITSALDIAGRLGPFETEINYGDGTADNMPEVMLSFAEPFGEKGEYDCCRIMLQYADLILILEPELNSVAWRDGSGGTEWHNPRKADTGDGTNAGAFARRYAGAMAEIESPTVREYLEAAEPEEFREHALVLNYMGAENRPLLDTFLEDVKNRRPASLDVVQYTVEGDPILSRLVYDGYRYYGGKDNSRDRFGDGLYLDYGEYDHLRVFNDYGAANFYLLDDTSLTHEGIMHYLMSSANLEPIKVRTLFYIEGENEYEEAIY